MYLPGCKILFSGLKPTDKTRSEIELLIQSLQSRSPSDGIIRLCLVGGESEINGFLSITSRSEKFESCKIGQDALKVVKLLKEDLLKQLKLWIGRREFQSNKKDMK